MSQLNINQQLLACSTRYQCYNAIRDELLKLESKYGISSVEFYDSYLECNSPSFIEPHIADEWAKLCDRFILYGGFW